MNYFSKEQRKELLDAVKEVYAKLAQRPVERNCTRRTECCQFNITGEMPKLTRCEAFLAAQAYRASGRKKLPETEVCPMLDMRTKKCVIYADRPFGCRTHFCDAAGGDYARGEVSDLIQNLEEIDAKFFNAGKGGISLPPAVKMFL